MLRNKMFYIVMFIVLFIAAGIVFYYFNLFEFKDTIENGILSVPVVSNAVQDKIKSDKDALNQEKKDLDKTKEELNKKNKQLTTKENNLNNQEKQMTKIQEDLIQKQQKVTGTQSSIEDLVKYYQAMDPESAANILNNVSDENTLILIFKSMSKSSASQIMQNMDPKIVAKITQDMLK